MIRGGSTRGGNGTALDRGLDIRGVPDDLGTTPRRTPRATITPRGDGAPAPLGAPERSLGGADPRFGTRGRPGLGSLTGPSATRGGDGFAPPPAPLPIVDPPPTPVPADPGGHHFDGAVRYHYDSLTCDWNDVCDDWAHDWHHGHHDAHHGHDHGWHGGWNWWCGPSSWFSWRGSGWSFSIGLGWGWDWGWGWGWGWPSWCDWRWRPASCWWRPVHCWARPAYVQRFHWYEASVPVETTWVSLHDAWALEPLASDDPIEPWCAPASATYLALVADDEHVVEGSLTPTHVDALEQAYLTLRDGDVVAADLAFARIVRTDPTELNARFGLFVTRWLWLDAAGATNALRPILRMDPAWLLNVPRDEYLDLQYRRLRDDLHRRAADGEPEVLLGAAALDAALGDLLSAYYHADQARDSGFAEEAENLKAMAANGLSRGM